MHRAYLPNTVFWVQRLIDQVTIRENPAERLLDEVEVVIECTQEALSDRMAESLLQGNLLKSLKVCTDYCP